MQRTALILALGTMVLGCGDDGGGGVGPEQAASLFANPTGTITNAAQAVNDAIAATLANEAANDANPLSFGFGSGSATKGVSTACFNSDGGSNVSIDLGCYADQFTQGMCNGSGSLSVNAANTDPNNLSVNFSYNNATLECGGGGLISCNGTGSYSTVGDQIISCNNLTCAGTGGNSSGCFSFDAMLGTTFVLVETEDGSIVCIRIVANADCTRSCSEWRDADGEAIILCDVTETNGEACETDGSTVTTVGNCTTDRTQSTCPATF